MINRKAIEGLIMELACIGIFTALLFAVNMLAMR